MEMAKNIAKLIVQEFRKWAVMFPTDILKEFQKQFGAQVHEEFYYAYRSGNKQLPLLVAHVDTVFQRPPSYKEIAYNGGKVYLNREADYGPGADDRLGVALIALLLREYSNVGFLLTNYEECGLRGAKVAAHDLADELKDYPYLLELDRAGCRHFAYYWHMEKFEEILHITEEFKKFLLGNLPGWDFKEGSSTDIKAICPKIKRCGVNIAIGYYNPHEESKYIGDEYVGEYIKVDDAVLAYHAVCKLLQQPVHQPFKLRNEIE